MNILNSIIYLLVYIIYGKSRIIERQYAYIRGWYIVGELGDFIFKDVEISILKLWFNFVIVYIYDKTNKKHLYKLKRIHKDFNIDELNDVKEYLSVINLKNQLTNTNSDELQYIDTYDMLSILTKEFNIDKKLKRRLMMFIHGDYIGPKLSVYANHLHNVDIYNSDRDVINKLKRDRALYILELPDIEGALCINKGKDISIIGIVLGVSRVGYDRFDYDFDQIAKDEYLCKLDNELIFIDRDMRYNS